MKLELANVNAVRKRLSSGKVRTYYYHRITQQRIKGEPGTLAFMHSYEAAAKAAETHASENTLSSVLLAYEKSPEFRKLAKNTKRVYGFYLGEIRGRFGETRLAAFEEKKIRAAVLSWRDEIAPAAPTGADQMVSVFKTVLAFAEGRNLISQNHLAGVKRSVVSDRSDQIWSAKEIKAILAVARPPLQRAIKLALFTGQRIGDLIRWKWSDYRNGMLYLQQEKTGAPVCIPVYPALAELLASMPRTDETILTGPRGKRWADRSTLAGMWRTALRKAGLADGEKRFHDLRGTAVTCLADMGCTEAQIASITGHSLEHVSKILRRYLKRTVTQAEAATAKLQASWIGRLQTTAQTELLTA